MKAATLQTDFCSVCGRERPTRALTITNGKKVCNDNHNDLQCHVLYTERSAGQRGATLKTDGDTT